MPRDFPGLYWDEQRQRYFPLASQPVDTTKYSRSEAVTPISNQKQVPQDAPSAQSNVMRGRQRIAPHRALADLRSLDRTARKDTLIHQIHSSQFALTDQVTRSAIPSLLYKGLVTAFQTVCHDGRVWSFAGDSMGWFYSSIIDNDNEAIGWHTSHGWEPEFNLSSEAPLSQVSSICVSGSRCIATSFGPECRILHLPLDSVVEDIRVSRTDTRIVHDVWTADFQASRLVLGANKQAVVIDDISDRAAVHYLPTNSDVFALAQDDSILYTGLRNGGILRFDTRITRSKGHVLLDGLFAQHSNSITNLKLLRDSQLLVGNVDGSISTFDLRFPACRTPLMAFHGNINSYTIKVPLVTDQSENILFAAGQDRKIRLWSLRTGGAPLVSAGADLTHQTAFQHQFEHPVRAMQIIEDSEGMYLWAASGSELYKYSLGHRNGIGI
ncbi:hypothetical protein PAXRUDRAFT_166620 [Paxillus rubicundulus Ve08.2h10]|uniref:Unplaced genomic scaffold scaffold_2133, whole genome shotgun sequence n=1 Tax=Paxillus rubicundulus Ve08.2h10 TaxID=930991 RepID=A0A0D0D1R7_9AGAM|nr:hypothetical protein PAXRUDRAFT_166620 [Paxillus rubicundulus Ve08.2h10]